MKSLVWIGFRSECGMLKYVTPNTWIRYVNMQMLSELLAEAAHLANPAPEWPNFPFHNDSFPAPLIINNRRPCRCCTPHELRFVVESGSALLTSRRVHADLLPCHISNWRISRISQIIRYLSDMQSLGRALDTIIKLSLLSPAACVQVQLGGTVSCALRYRARPDCHYNVHDARLS